MKVHLDTDFGGDIDDLCALALLLRWRGEVELTGVTTVAENGGLDGGVEDRSAAAVHRAAAGFPVRDD